MAEKLMMTNKNDAAFQKPVVGDANNNGGIEKNVAGIPPGNLNEVAGNESPLVQENVAANLAPPRDLPNKLENLNPNIDNQERPKLRDNIQLMKALKAGRQDKT